MFELKIFQSEAAALIARRYAYFAGHPARPYRGATQPRPFFQALSALTGAGKTPILAEAVSQMRAYFSEEPIVLWMSKAKSVVAQTYANFSPGGKYGEIVRDFKVINIQDIRPDQIVDGTIPLLVLTTTGLFNNKDQAEGALNIYRRGNDLFGKLSPWERLIERLCGTNRRPLLVVYDEGHNLSDQQTDLLAELEPDAYLVASATLKLPGSFHTSVLQHIRSWIEEVKDPVDLARLKSIDADGRPAADQFITTAVDSERVVEAQLVKKAIQFDGTTASWEQCLDSLMKRYALLKKEIKSLGLAFEPKAIYVCKTNVTDSGEKDDASKPFKFREAPPIRIWRYLVEQKNISPKEIAIYADLHFSDGNKPDEVNLFSNGENDFDDFASGDYKHIIFNKSLQEGWDDPACYLAYIDKSMGSLVQVEQVIGRVLRQFDATHYASAALNTAHFFLRVDKQSVFTEAIKNVREKLEKEGTPIEISGSFATGKDSMEELLPRNSKRKLELHEIYVDAEPARKRMSEVLREFITFKEGEPNTWGEALSTTQVMELDNLGKDLGFSEWKAGGKTNPVRLRWLLNNAIKMRSPGALASVDLKDSRFDVLVQVQSRADILAQKLARELVEAYFQQAELSYERLKPFPFGPVRTSKKAHPFKNSLYERYSALNKFELNFGQALDATGLAWHRNPSNGGFRIPLLSEGATGYFYPDFLVWKKDQIFCLDTKGGHILAEAVARKLFDIKEGRKSKVQVRFITEGKQGKLLEKPVSGGFTVWKMKSGSPVPIYFDDMKKAIEESVR